MWGSELQWLVHPYYWIINVWWLILALDNLSSNMCWLIIILKEAIIKHYFKEVASSRFLFFLNIWVYLDFLVKDVHQLMVVVILEVIFLWLLVNIYFHQWLHKLLDALLVSFVLHGVLVYESHNALLQNSLGHDVLTQGKQFVKNRENLFIEAVGDVIHNAI